MVTTARGRQADRQTDTQGGRDAGAGDDDRCSQAGERDREILGCRPSTAEQGRGMYVTAAADGERRKQDSERERERQRYIRHT